MIIRNQVPIMPNVYSHFYRDEIKDLRQNSKNVCRGGGGGGGGSLSKATAPVLMVRCIVHDKGIVKLGTPRLQFFSGSFSFLLR